MVMNKQIPVFNTALVPKRAVSSLLMMALALVLLSGCTPTVKVEAPDKPIEINMNVNIRHEILIKVEKEVEEMFEDEELF